MQRIQGKKYLWYLPSSAQDDVLRIASRYNLSFPIAQTLVARGLTTEEAIDAFLFTSFERDVAHPSLMKDAQKAVDRIVYALEHDQKILVVGDYDVDGVTSSAVMLSCLLPLDAQINFFLPNRARDGYGLSEKIIDRAARNGYKVVITVDNGITAFEPAKKAKVCGIDLIITDHHRPHDAVPEAFAIVNPAQQDCPYPFKSLAGVGVAFKVMSLLYESLKKPLPDKLYELLMLGTIADVVPLKGENRFWVRHGLSYVNRSQSYAFQVLKQNGKIKKQQLSSTDIGFSIAPQINALGRLEDARDGVKFLIGSNRQDVDTVGATLLELNEARKGIERSIFLEIQQQIVAKKIDLDYENVIVAASKSWPTGVIGLVASRLVSAYGRPAILFHITKDGIAKGSCRSIPEFNMFDALCHNKDLLHSFGGHSLAAGLSLSLDSVAELKASLERLIKEQLSPEDLAQKLVLDAQAKLSDLTKKFIGDMRNLEPFGHENRQPCFYFEHVALVQKPMLLKDAHVKCMFFADGVIKPVIFFNRPELFSFLSEHQEEPFCVAAQVLENHWNGVVSIELSGVDIALSHSA